MTFTVTYRDRTGAIREEVVNAASRAECVAACRASGISPIAIREGGSAASPRRPQPRTDGARNNAGSAGARDARPYHAGWRVLAVLGILACLAILGGGAWWWYGGGREATALPDDTSVAKPQAMPKEVRPPVATNANNVAATNTPKGGIDAEGYRIVKTPFGEKRVKPRYSKAVLAALSCADAPPVQDLRPPPPDPNAPPPPPPRYKNNLHIQLSEYAWSGRFVGVPDPMSDREARKLVEEKVEILPDDPPEVRQEKETVAAMQEELKEYLAKGGHANDYFMELMKRQDAENETIREARRQIRELCDAGDVELAEQARDKFNEYLKGKGLPPIIMANYLKHAKKKAEEKNTEGKKAQGGAGAPEK